MSVTGAETNVRPNVYRSLLRDDAAADRAPEPHEIDVAAHPYLEWNAGRASFVRRSRAL